MLLSGFPNPFSSQAFFTDGNSWASTSEMMIVVVQWVPLNDFDKNYHRVIILNMNTRTRAHLSNNQFSNRCLRADSHHLKASNWSIFFFFSLFTIHRLVLCLCQWDASASSNLICNSSKSLQNNISSRCYSFPTKIWFLTVYAALRFHIVYHRPLFLTIRFKETNIFFRRQPRDENVGTAARMQ